MKLFTGCLAAGLVLVAAGAQAQMLAPTRRTLALHVGLRFRRSLCGGAAGARPGRAYGYGPRLLPPKEVYTVLRENGFSPLGIPRQRGFVYTIAVIDRGGESGRLIIDARDGRIVRFRPGYRIGNNFNEEPARDLRPAAGRCRRSTPRQG